MIKLTILVLALVLVSCGHVENQPFRPTELMVTPANPALEVPDPSEEATSTPIITEYPVPIDPSDAPESTLLPDFSEIKLVEAVHLMDPQYFQIALDGWPRKLPEGVRLLVGGTEFKCDQLFTDQYPDRVYCWGTAPDRGTEATIQVLLPQVDVPVMEIPFVVPSPGGG